MNDHAGTETVIAVLKTNIWGEIVKLKHMAQVMPPAVLWAVSLSASAQVVTIGYAQDQGVITDVPFSPWTTAAIAIVLALTAWAFLSRKGGTGLLLLALTIAGGGLASQSQDVKALVGGGSCTSLTQLPGTQVGCLSLTLPSPKVTTDYGFIVGGWYGFLDVVNNTGAGITLSSVSAVDGVSGGIWSVVATPTSFPSAFNIFAPTCTVGLHLAAAGRCSLYLRSAARD